MAAHPATITTTTSSMTPPGAKKIFLSRDGKFIGHQIGSTTPAVSPAAAVPVGKVAIAPTPLVTRITASPATPQQLSSSPVAAASSLTGSQQKVQIVKTADGKIQVSWKIYPMLSRYSL